MPRDIDSTLLGQGLAAASVGLAVLFMATFTTGKEYAWSGVGPLVWNGMMFRGVGSLGKLSGLPDGGDRSAQGVKVELSGLDAEWLADVQTEIRQGAPAKIWLAAVTPELGLIGTPYLAFRGGLDKAIVSIEPPSADGSGTCSISLNIEDEFINHGRPCARRYTAADQRANGYPDDSAFDRVEVENDLAENWGG